jgi:hypothetical protein
MKGFLIGCGVLFAGGAVLLIGAMMWYFGIVNREVTLRNQAKAQETANQAVFDNMWKSIAQIAQVNDEYKEDFRKSWKDILGAQSGDGRAATVNVVMNRINPKFDSSLSKKVMTVIEGSRKEFLNNQEKLIDIKREHDNLRETVPSKWIVGSVAELKITIITSTRTSDTFESGKDDDISIRKKPELKVEPDKK